MRVTDEIKQNVIMYYKSYPMTLSSVSEQFNISIPTIIKILNEENVDRYKKAIIYNPELQEDFFENIDSEYKSYFLGLILTDGNVYYPYDGRQKSISISQNTEDAYILQLFLSLVHSNNSISNDGRGCSSVAIRSNKMADDLMKFGIVPNKSLTSYLPILHDSLMPHLIRGILDGDGNIKAHQTNVNNRYAHAISFCGTYTLMNNIAYYLSQKLNIKIPSVYTYSDKSLSEVKWQSKDDMFIIGEWMYGDAHIFLKRKYEKYLAFKNHYFC